MTHTNGSPKSAALFEQAREVLAGGVSRNTILRQPHPLYAERASGCRIVDVDGIERLDFANNMASLIHGHAHPAIVCAVTQQLARGTAFTMGTEIEIRYARQLCDRSPGFERIRFVNSGTEAVMAAMKAARAFTGRSRVAKVEGTYHGAYDYAEVSQAPDPAAWGERLHPTSVPLADGTPAGVMQDVIVLPFNEVDAAIAVLDTHQDDIACVLVDPMPHRAGLIPSRASYIEALHAWTRAHGALLVFDEVVSFRTDVGGMQARYNVQADLTALGKIIGGGFPVGAVTGREDVMTVFSTAAGKPRLPHSGTFSANPVTMMAGSVAMALYDAAAVERLNELGDRARSQIREAIAVTGVPASVTGVGSLFRIHLKAEAPVDYRSSVPTPTEAHAMTLFLDALYDAGIMLVHTGAGILSTPMGEAEIDRLTELVVDAFGKIRHLAEAPPVRASV